MKSDIEELRESQKEWEKVANRKSNLMSLGFVLYLIAFVVVVGCVPGLEAIIIQNAEGIRSALWTVMIVLLVGLLILGADIVGFVLLFGAIVFPLLLMIRNL